MMKIKNYRKQEFRDKVYHVAISKGFDPKCKKIKYNFNYKCETHVITINGKKYDDCVAYFYKKIVIDGRDVSSPQPILYSDILQLDRKNKLEKIEGKNIEIIKEKKVRRAIKKPEPKMMLEVGKQYKLVGLLGKSTIEIVRKTPKQFKYIYVYSNDKEEKTLRVDLYGNWVTGNKHLGNSVESEI